MKRHPGNILARPSLDEIFRFYAGKHYTRVRRFIPVFFRRKMKKWDVSPQGGLYRMLTALLFGLRLIDALLRRIYSNPWRVPVLPVYALTGTALAVAFVVSWAHWPDPVSLMDVDGLLLSCEDSHSILAWSEETITVPSLTDIEIPPELYPVGDLYSNFQHMTALNSSKKGIKTDSVPPDQVASLSLLNFDSRINKPAKPKYPPVNGVHHVVLRGETLWDIAQAYSVDCELVEGYNPHINPRKMQLGQKVFIPGADSPIAIPRKSKMILPIRDAWVVSGFGMRKHPLGGVLRFHRGIDMPADVGTPVRAAMDGVVEEVGWRGTLGRYVKIKHSGGFETVYAHNSRIEVKAGEKIREGRIISYSGSSGRSTGPHLHFEVIKNGKHVDPEQFLPRISHTRPSKNYTLN